MIRTIIPINIGKDAASDARFEMSQSIADFRIRSMMCAPLLDVEGEAFGVLQIDTLDQRNRFQKDDLEVLVSVAGQAAIAINKYLTGDDSPVYIPDEKSARHTATKLALGEEETTEDQPRIEVEFEDARERVSDFREVEKGFTEKEACREATRCLRCDLEKEENGI